MSESYYPAHATQDVERLRLILCVECSITKLRLDQVVTWTRRKA